MTTTTPGKIITRALLKSGVIGVGQTASSEDMADGLSDLQDMLAQWQRQRWLIYHLVDVFALSTGALSYTVGTGGDFNVTRPDRLEAAFFRQIIPSQQNPIDYPFELIQSREDYNRIAQKTLGTWPQAIFYDSAYPTGVAYPWPVPMSGNFQIHLTLKAQLGDITSLSQVINLPPEYNQAIWSNLAVIFRESYQLAPRPSLNAIAKKSLAVIRGANAQIPTLIMPRGLAGRGSRYNVYSDTTN